MACLHTITSGRENERGSWCVACGAKVYEVDERKLLELAERCEAATGPDRLLDAETHVAYGRSENNPIATLAGWCVGSATNPNPVNAPAYTASLDAAMTLVPEGWYLNNLYGHRYLDKWHAIIELKGGSKPAPGYCSGNESPAATPALALTAACLRARAHLTGDRP